MFFKEKLICNLFHVCWECEKKGMMLLFWKQ